MNPWFGIPRRERTGLLLITAALVVIASVSALVLKTEQRRQIEEIRGRGVALVRVLSKLPAEQLLAGEGPQHPLSLVYHGQGGVSFAYVAVTDRFDRPLVELARPGVVVGRQALPVEPASWIGERGLESGKGERIREFFAPVMVDGERVADLRLGFIEPGLGQLAGRGQFLAALALPVFLLAPLAYFLLRWEIRPLEEITRNLASFDEDGTAPVEIKASGALEEFFGAFNRFVQLTEERAKALEVERGELLSSSRVLFFQKGRMEVILASLPFGTLVADEGGEVIFANRRFADAFGVSVDEIRGHPLEQWCASDLAKDFLAPYCRPTTTGRRRADEIELGTDAGVARSLRLSAHPLENRREGHEALGTLLLVRDAEAAVGTRGVQTEFLSHVAHELKTPLNVFSMYSELLLGKDGENEEFRIEACNTFQDQVERLSTLVETLLSIARIQSGEVVLERQRVRLPDFLRDAVSAIEPAARAKQISIQLDLSEDTPAAVVDKGLFGVAISNLLSNAIKYNRADGEVEVSLRDDGGQLVIGIRDTGIGVADADREAIFEKFYRAGDAAVQERSGHGLGLALTKEIVELHGGRIAVTSAEGGGSLFSITLFGGALERSLA